MAGQETFQRFYGSNADDEPDQPEDLNCYYYNNQGITESYLRILMHHKKEEDKMVQELAQYNSLLKAIASNDWKEVKVQLDLKPSALHVTSAITEFSETILHILVNSDKALWLVKEIVDKIDTVSLGKTDYQGDTALNIAAYAGNAKAAKMIARKNPDLVTKTNYIGDSPFHAAARYGHPKTFRSLLSVAQNTDRINDKSIFSGKSGATIVEYLISANLYGLALVLLKLYPKLSREDLRQRRKILEELAAKPLEFESGCKFGPWKRLIYKAISVKDEVIVPPEHDD